MLALLTPVSSCGALAAPPPLTDDDRTALQSVVDNQPIADDAGLSALLKNVDQWTPESFQGFSLVPLNDDLAQQCLSDPAAQRGTLIGLTGSQPFRITLEALKYHDLEAWQMKIDQPPGVALVLIDTRPAGPIEVDSAVSVTIPVRFLKTIDTQWKPNPGSSTPPPTEIPLFVGALPDFTLVPATTAPSAATMAVIIAAGVVAFFLLRLMIRRQSVRLSQAPTGSARSEAEPPETNLPEDPAEALAELRRRADNTGDHGQT